MTKPMTLDDVMRLARCYATARTYSDAVSRRNHLESAIEAYAAEQVAAERGIAHNAGFTEASRIHGAEIESYKQDAERYAFTKTIEGQALMVAILRDIGAHALDLTIDAVRARAQEE